MIAKSIFESGKKINFHIFDSFEGLSKSTANDGNFHETLLKERDLASVPPGYYRGLYNIGQEEALMLVMLGNKKPVTPHYPPDHPLTKIKRPKK